MTLNLRVKRVQEYCTLLQTHSTEEKPAYNTEVAEIALPLHVASTAE